MLAVLANGHLLAANKRTDVASTLHAVILSDPERSERGEVAEFENSEGIRLLRDYRSAVGPDPNKNQTRNHARS